MKTKLKKSINFSLTKSKENNLPYKYYPVISTPLRQKEYDVTYRLKLQRKKAVKRRKSKSKSRSRKSASRGKHSRSRSRSASAKRRLVYDDYGSSEKSIRRNSVLIENVDYLSNTDARELAFFLREVQAYEHKLEIVKTQLALQPDFNLLDAFSIFDKNGSGWVHYFDIVDELKK